MSNDLRQLLINLAFGFLLVILLGLVGRLYPETIKKHAKYFFAYSVTHTLIHWEFMQWALTERLRSRRQQET
jgi:uncharacterized protein YjeT (DUF2065 family)